jgi:hypothetical protein
MSNVAREMVRTYFGMVGNDSDRRLQKIRELRDREFAALEQPKRAKTSRSQFTPVRGRIIG